MLDAKGIAAEMLPVIRGYVERSIAELQTAFEKRLAEIPAGPQGDPGERGAQGETGPAGSSGPKGEPGEVGPQGEKGPDGEVGDAGTEGAQGPVGLVGSDGEQGVAGPDGEVGPQGERGEKGESGLTVKGDVGDRGEPGARGETGLRGEKGIDGRDGALGLDAIELKIIDNVDEARSYPRGTYAVHKDAFIRAARQTSAIKEGDLTAAGWDVVFAGEGETDIEQSEDLRTFVIRHVKADGRVTEKSFSLPVVLDRGVYVAGKEYAQGDGSTWGGSFWIAQKSTSTAPGTSDDWRLAVKKGRDGKDGGGERKPHGPVKLL